MPKFQSRLLLFLSRWLPLICLSVRKWGIQAIRASKTDARGGRRESSPPQNEYSMRGANRRMPNKETVSGADEQNTVRIIFGTAGRSAAPKIFPKYPQSEKKRLVFSESNCFSQRRDPLLFVHQRGLLTLFA